ncbi:MAG: bifunctional 4-hydroxy-2-oxoglutarate aldolase/2-dehydro-3-deoxy-phosphogluconate aldolase [Cytophagales bacterium]|nr:bifunctional 4-hydroxy-2-oxoglutarate aldolase/2-dehydro-3-deoxy-phosphogluconate aldolase [Cytophagales bacterium]
MNRITILNQIIREGIVAILRLDDEKQVMPLVEALAAGGVHAIEITMGTPGVLRHIERIATHHPGVLIGVGSVLDAETARMALYAGARFIVTPVTRRKITEMAHRYDAPVFSGAFTPGEILTAFEGGADVVKVFPAEVLGIPYLKAVLAPMPQLRLMPTGGVTVDNAADWLRAGACALGVGSALVDKKALAAGDFAAIQARAEAFVSAVAQYKAG